MANHSCILSCLGIQWTEQPGALQSMGSQNQTGLNDWAGKRTTPSIWRILLTTRMYSLDWLKLENWWCLKLHLDATNPRIVHEVIMPCSLNTIKLLTTPSRVGHTILRALAYCGPLCQSNKSCSFILHPKLCVSVQHGWTETEFGNKNIMCTRSWKLQKIDRSTFSFIM